MATTAEQAVPIQVPVGVVKSFGEYGPQYEVLSYAGRSERGHLVRIRVYPSLEETDYRYAAMLADPEVVQLFAVAFDLVIADVERHHPKGVPQAYGDIAKTLADYGFRWAQGSVYLTDDESLANVVEAITSLRELPWFP